MNKFDVTLRKGLNIVLAKDVGGKGAVNSVGKSTFVRLIDYGLGSNPFLQGKIAKDKLSNVFLLMEFSIGNIKYTIKRNLIDGKFCTLFKGWVIDKLKKSEPIQGESIPINGYRAKLETALFNNKNYYDNERILTLRQFIYLLIRKQGSGFEKIDDPMGVREGAKLKRQRLQFISNLLSEEIKSLNLKISDAEEQSKESKNEYFIIKKYIEQRSKEYSFELRERKDKVKKEIDIMQNELKKHRIQLSEIQQRNDKVQNERRKCVQKLGKLNEEISLYQSRITNYSATYNEIQEETRAIDIVLTARDWFEGYAYKKCPTCLKPLNNHGEIDCEEDNVSQEDNVAIETIRGVIENEKEELKEAIQTYNLGLKNLEVQKVELHDKIAEIDEIIKFSSKSLLSKITFLEEELKGQYEEEIYINNLLKALDDINLYEKKWKEDKKHVTDLKKKLSDYQMGMDQRMEQLKTCFNEVVKYLYNDTKKGLLTLSSKAKNMEVKILNNSEFEEEDLGDATQITKVVAFDLALLKLALIDNTIHPKFLIHDSPNVRDVDPEVYKKIMTYVLELEEEYKGEFQYIITTLVIPDNVKQDSIFVRCLLDNSGDGGKLFGFTF
ncbi:DUF2326 domain-containing protein [Bacillus thuringiensis]|nr:DUF2326 domain-containing protein [Bacillus thuringiensis]